MLRKHIKKHWSRVMQNNRVFVRLFGDSDFNGRSLRFRGSLAIRNMDHVNFDNNLSSLRFSSNGNGTLVLFSSRNYQGDFIVIRGNNNVRDLDNQNFNNRTSSLIAVNRRLSRNEIRQIQNNQALTFRAPEIL